MSYKNVILSSYFQSSYIIALSLSFVMPDPSFVMPDLIGHPHKPIRIIPHKTPGQAGDDNGGQAGDDEGSQSKDNVPCHLERRPKAAVERSTPKSHATNPKSQKDRPRPSPNLSKKFNVK